MNYPSEIYADTDLVCGEEPKEGHEKYVRADEHDKLVAAVNNLVEIVEGVRNVRWAYDQWRLKDTPEWCALYSAWSKHGASDRRSNKTMTTTPDPKPLTWPVRVDAEKPGDDKLQVVYDDGPCAGMLVATCSFEEDARQIVDLWNKKPA